MGTPSHGTATISGIAFYTVIYTPTTDYVGPDSFTYTITDASGATASTTISFTITNSAPNAVNDAYSTNVNVPKTVTPMENDSDPDGQTISLQSVGTPSSGTAVISSSSVIYTPNTNFAGTDSFLYTIVDASGATASATITFTVINNPPVAVADSYSTNVNVPKTVLPMSNDSEPDSQTITITSVGSPSHGTVVINGGTSITYNPSSNYAGADSFTYTISDPSGGSSSATISFTIVNNAPIAVNDAGTTTVNTPINLTPMSNDNDPDGQSITITSTTSPSHGSVVITGTGTEITYTPTSNYAGTDTFTYTITDASGATSTATITITINNTPPVAIDDTATTNMNTAITITPMTNDFDPDLQTITITSIPTPPTHGTATFTSTSITFTPTTNYFGPDSLDYTITDASGGTATATVSFTILNTKPDAVDDNLTSTQGATISITPLDNDSDPEGRTITIQSVGTTSNGGSVSIVDSTTLSYTPLSTFTGTETFTYTIVNTLGLTDTATISVTISVAAVIANPNSYSTAVNVAKVLSTLLDNDVGTSITIKSTTGMSNGGTVTISGDKLTINYTPATNYIGTETFTYIIEDTFGNTASALVTITITNSPPVASPDTYPITVNTVSTFSPLSNDNDPDENQSPSLSSVGTPSAGGTAIISGNDVIYTPPNNFVGTDVFTYSIVDPNGATSTSTITVTITNRNPDAVDDSTSTPVNIAKSIAVLPNDSDPDGQTITVTSVSQPTHGSTSIQSGTTVLYTPTSDYAGSDSFTYTITDASGGTDTATVNINVINTPPVAADDSYTTNVNVAKSMLVLTNDSDPDGQSISITSVGSPTHGSVVINSESSSLTYTPNTNYASTDSFTYTISDASGAPSTATVTISIINTAPQANSDSYSTPVNTPITVSPKGNDVDPDGQGITITSTSSPSHGTVTINGGNTITYSPDANFAGSDSFTYTITDDSGATSTATITVNIVNTAPNANPDTSSTFVNIPVDIYPLPNDVDPDSQTITIQSVGTPLHGTAVFSGSTVTYTPDQDYAGSDSFLYTIVDASGATASATISVTVVNRPPVAVSDSKTTTVNVPLTFNPTTNDSDPDSQTITLTSVGTPSHGTATISGNTVIYTPTTDYVGSDSFTYTITDASGATASTTISFTITNSAPNAVNDAYSTNVNVPKTVTPMENDSDPDGQTISLQSVGTPSSGTAVISSSSVIYTPNTNFAGTDSFLYTIVDASGATASATITFTVINNPPVAVADSYSTNVNVPKTVSPMSNDSEPDSQTITITSVGSPSHGTVVINGGTSITYNPSSNYAGADSFTYTISDPSGGSSSATISFTIVNNAPIAVNDAGTTTVNTPINLTPMSNDNDPDGQSITITSTTSPSHGSVVITGTGTGITYTPTSNYAGIDTFTYTITDASGATSTATITITINNTPPVAIDDTATTNMNTAITITPMTNDFDPDLQTITITSIQTPPTHGTATFTSTSITFTPTTNYFGPDSLDYTITDASGGTATATVSFTIFNTKPDAVDDNLTSTQGTTISIKPLDNDSDPEGRTITIQSVGTTSNGGSVSIVDSTTLSYTPLSTFTGTETFTYTIVNTLGLTDTATISVTISVAAVIANPNSYSTAVNVAKVLSTLLDNDVGTSITIKSTTGMSNGGTATISGDKLSINYTPATNYIGTETFTYIIEDTFGNTASALVTITITNSPPVASPDTYPITVNTVSTFSPLSNDNDPDVNQSPSLSSVGTPSAGGTATISGNDVIYTPPNNFVGTDVFTYSIVDPNGATSTSTITVTITNRNPDAVDDSTSTPVNIAKSIAVLPNDSDPDGQTITVTSVSQPTHGFTSIQSGTTVLYTPTSDYAGSDSFTYTITDASGGTDTATVNINVINTPPVAADDSYTTNVNVAKSMLVLTNDSDPDGQSISITSVGSPTHGSVVINSGSSSLTYTPNTNYASTDSFTYTISDASGAPSTATVTISIINTAPQANSDSYSTPVNTPITVSPKSNDVDPDGQGITITSTSSPSHGTVTINGGNTITYSPDTNFAGSDSFTYTIIDDSGATSTATITVNIVNTAPNANPDTSNTFVNIPVDIYPLPNDVDPDSQTITIQSVGTPLHGTAVFSGSTVTYTPDQDYAGSDSFLYTIVDASGATASATISVTVVNRPPVALDDSYTTNMNTPISFIPTTNDSDPDSQAISISAVNILASQGTVTIIGNSVQFTPPTDFLGVVLFTYTIIDPSGGTSSANIAITVEHPPIVSNPDTYTDTVNKQKDLTPIDNDSDPFGHDLTISNLGVTSHGGTVFINSGSKSISYTPFNNFVGVESFAYTIVDPFGITSTSTITVTISNTVPVANDDSVTTNVNTPVTFSPLPNDVDPDGQSIIINQVGTTPSGTIIFDDSLITFTPNTDVSGIITFTYEIIDPNGGTDTATITVTINNSNPLAGPDSFSTQVNTPITAQVLLNDIDPDGQSLSIQSVSSTTNGGTTTFTTTSITYTPPLNFVGTDTFTYTISDPSGGTSTTTVTITVETIIDAVDDSYSTPVNSPITVQPLQNDIDPSGTPLQIISASTPTNGGSVSISPDGTKITYTPATNTLGTDSFQYTIQNSFGNTDTATITIQVQNVPIALNDDLYSTPVNTPITSSPLGNDVYVGTATITTVTQPPNGVTSISGNTVTYTPTKDFAGTNTVQYTIIDSVGNVGTATITYIVVNQNPVAQPDTATTSRSKMITIDPLTNDSDPDNQAIGITQIVSITSGTATISGTGSEISFTPSSTGTAVILYMISDPSGGTATSTITITVSPEIVIANDDSYDIQSNTPSTFFVLNNDGSSNNDILQILSSTSSTQGGSTSISLDKTTITYTPSSNFYGKDTFTYTAINSYGDTDTATVTITVNHANPVAIPDTYEITVNTPLTISPILNDIPGDGVPVTISSVGITSSGGVVTIVDGSTLTYTPPSQFCRNRYFYIFYR